MLLELALSAALHAPSDDAAINDVVFPIAAKHGLSASHKAISDDDLRGEAHAICNGFSSGLDRMTIAQSMMTGFNTIVPGDPLTLNEVGYVIGASTAAYCPAYNDAG